MSRTCIRRRLDAALEKARWQKMEVRAIYLAEADLEALNRLLSEEFGEGFKIHAHGYAGHILRLGKESTVYSTFGQGIDVPKRLSHRTEQPS